MRSKIVTWICLMIYLCLLTWVIIFKLDVWSIVTQAQSNAARSINLVPFAGTAIYDGQLDYRELLLNMVFFIPYGLYLASLFEKTSWWKNLLGIVVTSALYEIVQYGFGIGVTDITDLLFNSLGGLVGLLFFASLQKRTGQDVVLWVNRLSLFGLFPLSVLLYLIQ